MPRTKTKGRNCDSGHVVNDNPQPPSNAITLTELASAMQLDEDTILRRFAAILSQEGDYDIR